MERATVMERRPLEGGGRRLPSRKSPSFVFVHQTVRAAPPLQSWHKASNLGLRTWSKESITQFYGVGGYPTVRTLPETVLRVCKPK